MGKCLVTKLNGVINNDALLKIGELRFKVKKVDSPSKNSQEVSVSFVEGGKINIIGEGYFTDSTLSSNLGKSIEISDSKEKKLYLSNGDYEVSIMDKYNLVGLNLTNTDVTNKEIDLDSFKYTNSLNYLYIYGTKVSSDISVFQESKNLRQITIHDTSVTGDISVLGNLTALNSVNLSNTSVTGDISVLGNLTALNSVNLSNTSVTGDISVLGNLTNLNEDILGFKTLNLVGDLAKLPAKTRWFSNFGGKSSFTWTSRPSTSTLFAIEAESATVDNIDQMLKDFAQCIAPSNLPEDAWYKTIKVKGNRTSASDNAVTTLQQKGYTVSITPA